LLLFAGANANGLRLLLFVFQEQTSS